MLVFLFFLFLVCWLLEVCQIQCYVVGVVCVGFGVDEQVYLVIGVYFGVEWFEVVYQGVVLFVVFVLFEVVDVVVVYWGYQFVVGGVYLYQVGVVGFFVGQVVYGDVYVQFVVGEVGFVQVGIQSVSGVEVVEVVVGVGGLKVELVGLIVGGD